MLQKRRVPGEKWRTEGTSDSHRTAWTDRLKEPPLTPRTNTLEPCTEPRSPTERVPLVITYHPIFHNTAKILKRHLPILHISEKLRGAIPNPPLV